MLFHFQLSMWPCFQTKKKKKKIMNTRTIPQLPSWSGFNLGKKLLGELFAIPTGSSKTTKTLYNLPETITPHTTESTSTLDESTTPSHQH